MPSFFGLLILTAVAFGAPFLLGLFPRIRLPAVVLEIVAGIAVGPSLLGWVHVDQTIAVISTLGLAFLLFLAGLEIDFARLRGRVLTSRGSASPRRSRSRSWSDSVYSWAASSTHRYWWQSPSRRRRWAC
jgi:Kef-type K+ transport system membrane component KefB